MNIFKGLLFLEGHLTASRPGSDDFGPQFGNKLASERTFANRFASLAAAATVPHDTLETCSAGGCG